MTNAKVDVIVNGAVERVGHQLIDSPATVAAALQAAGGLANRERMRPSGVITVRRPLGNRKVDVWRFHLSDPDPQWKSFELQQGDLVVFQWLLDSDEPASQE
jgi:protein involved in polysaccharide export with SLBB domain